MSAQEASSGLTIDVNAKGEYVTIENTGNEPYDLSGLTLSFDDGQTGFTFGDGVTLGAGESVTVGTGDQTEIDADYDAGYEGHLLNNDDPDTVKLLDGDAVVASSADENTDDSTSDESDDDSTTDSDGDESSNEDTSDDSESGDDSDSGSTDDSEGKSSDGDATDDSDESDSDGC
ncbi:lamin tail domain-containing protein [Haladaptatus salinisoli]|uniref:lamin tail domain-containing protein n=1 Tax=Haladaptatus salinisoli TaxID=2884876 RepID=UPI001D0B3833|nr:lamin tail domain-containing protein [Haladaptatus salinisoli]